MPSNWLSALVTFSALFIMSQMILHCNDKIKFFINDIHIFSMCLIGQCFFIIIITSVLNLNLMRGGKCKPIFRPTLCIVSCFTTACDSFVSSANFNILQLHLYHLYVSNIVEVPNILPSRTPFETLICWELLPYSTTLYANLLAAIYGSIKILCC